MTLDDLITRLGANAKVKLKSFHGFPGLSARCPAHDDQMPSFYAWDDGLWLHLRCPVCNESSILSALGWDEDDRKSQRIVPKEPQKKSVITGPKPPDAFYDYVTPAGAKLMCKHRFYLPVEGGWKKSFSLKAYDAQGNLLDNTSTIPEEDRDTLYQCNYVLRYKGSRRIYIVNGEKAADRMAKERLLATCPPYGEAKTKHECEAKWKPGMTRLMAGAIDVCIICQRDDPGIHFAQYIFSQLRPVVGKITITTSATPGLKDDAYDHFEAGLTVADLIPRSDLIPTDPDDNPFPVKTLDEYDPEYPTYLWEPYIRESQINLLDAKGAGGKTSLVVALAVQGSTGYLPFVGDVKPFKTLYFGSEDTPGEMRVLYDQLGGRPGYFHTWPEPFLLTDENLARVEATIRTIGARFVCFDALSYYIGNLVKNPFNGMELQPYFAKLAAIARNQRAAILDIRHFSQTASDKAVENMGAGSEQWRNSHRSQLVLRPHPDREKYPRLSICVHPKGSLNSRAGNPFGFQIKDGELFWIDHTQIDLSVFDKKEPVRKKAEKRMEESEVVAWLKAKLCDGERVDSETIFRDGESAGATRDMIFRARSFLPVRVEREGAIWYWFLADPFAD